jgi:dipeptidase E
MANSIARRLVLYSEQRSPLSDAVDARLLDWLPEARGAIGYLPSAPDRDRYWFAACERHYARYGISLEYLGLEDEFDAARLGDLSRFDALHLSGGNTFRFLYWLRARGLVAELRRYVAHGGVLVGVSAGAILMTRDIASAALCGDAPYPPLTDDAGLGLVDFGIVPHFATSARERAALARLAAQSGGRVYGVPDGAGIVVDGSTVELLGSVIVSA